MINVTFSVDLSALERSLQKERAAVKVRQLRTSFFFFFGFSRPLNPRSGLRRPSTKASYGQPTINHGAVGEVSRGAIALKIWAGIEAKRKPSPLKGLGIFTHPDFQTFLRLEPRTQCY